MLARIILVLALVASPLSSVAECLGDYNRLDYPHWGPSENYADIRQEIIAGAVVADMVVENGKVVAGLWYDPFTGQNYALDVLTSDKFRVSIVKPDVDHLASLGWVHARGGACMTREQRRAIANDPENLWAVHPSANRQKGANVSVWLPANFGICTPYLQQLKMVVVKHKLILTNDDKGTYNELVVKCEDWRNGIKIIKIKKWYEGLFDE